MSENLADNVASFTTAYIVNDDIIARTSIQGFEALRDGILDFNSANHFKNTIP